MMILKLGGAAITDKNKKNTLKTDVIYSVLEQIVDFHSEILLVHGAGSFGHVDAKKYLLRHGINDSISLDEQRIGVSRIKSNLKILDTEINNIAIELGINPFTLSISSMMLSDGDDDEKLYLDALDQCIAMKFMPILCGDMVFDMKTGFRVVSGDRIIKLLAERYKDKDLTVIFGTDIDGLYNKNPNEFKDARLIERIEYDKLDELIIKAGDSAGVDVTGGMAGKLQQIKDISSLGIDVIMVNITEKNRLRKVLNREHTIATFISGKK